MRTIYTSDYDGIRWEVTSWRVGSLRLVRFMKHSKTAKLLDQTASWTNDRWDTSRWTPLRVPRHIVSTVEDYLRKPPPHPFFGP
jgi:hypothetical protein